MGAESRRRRDPLEPLGAGGATATATRSYDGGRVQPRGASIKALFLWVGLSIESIDGIDQSNRLICQCFYRVGVVVCFLFRLPFKD